MGIHGLAVLALTPWFFSWLGVALVVIGHYAFGMLGITLGYHRLLTHRGFTCPKWFEYSLAVLGVCCLQDTPARWVAIHRMHHQHSDDEPDPHSPLVDFLWAHIGWLFVESRDHISITRYERYARDLLRDPFYLWLARWQNWIGVYLAHAMVFFVVGFLVGLSLTDTYWAATHVATCVLLWGVFVRTVVVWHITWSVNSVTHIWGYRNYNTSDNSRNNWIVGLLAHGEGWHNNHHAHQRCAVHGHQPWEFDLTWQVVRGLEWLGLVGNVVRPRAEHLHRKAPLD